jgi:PAS domain S-box-containing protein
MNQRLAEDLAVEDVLTGGGEMGALTRAFDWSSTSLGPVSEWPQSLRTAVGILLATRHPMFLWWGPELIQFYNDGYRPSLGPDRHPSALGQPGRECWSEIWDVIGPQIDAIMEGGEATWHEDHLVPITRGSRVLDVYWSYSYSPVRLENGKVGGVLVTVQETTKRVVSDRRLQILRDLASYETEARSGDEAYSTVVSLLSRHETDLPYVLLYRRQPETGRLLLAGATGNLPERSAPPSIEPGDDSPVWPVWAVMASTVPLVINHPNQAGFQAMVLPIENKTPDRSVEGVLIAGVNPRITFDPAYQEFLAALVTQVERGITSAKAYEAARGRAEALRHELSRLAPLFEQAPGFMAVLQGPDHVLELTNPVFSQVLGHRDVLGKPLREALPEVESQGFVELMDKVYQTGQPFVGSEAKLNLQRTPGAPLEERYFNFMYQPMRATDGSVSGVLAFGYDVTDHVRSREQAERLAAERDTERSQLLTVLAQSPLAIIIVEAPSGRVLYANPKVSEVFGRDVLADQVASYGELYLGFHLDGRPLQSHEWPVARAIHQGQVVEHEVLTIRHASGRTAEIKVNAAPVRDATGNIIAGVAILWDVTAERRREQQLRDAQRLQSVGTLAGGVAHEINNQMTVVLGFCRFALQALGSNHPQTHDLELALRAADRAASVSQQLLAFTRLQVTQPRHVLLHQLTWGLAPVLRQLLGSDKTLEIEPSRSSTAVHADPNQIEQILINLVANARDATDTGDQVRITVKDLIWAGSAVGEASFAIPPGNYVLLTVADTGRGMNPETRARVFEPFYTTKPVGQGTGLGLSTVYGIVKQHGGYITAESGPGQGAVFTIYWPAAVSEEPAVKVIDAPPGVPDGRRRSATVLVVEDESEVRALVVRALEEEGYTVRSAPDGAAALELMQDGEAVDAVITDIIMPRLNGRQLRDRLATLHPELPVLFMSGHAAEASVLRELIPPGAPFLQKPFTPDDLSRAVMTLLSRAP